MPYSRIRRQQTCDHRLRDLVRASGEPDILAALGVSRSTAFGWLHRDYQPVITAGVGDSIPISLPSLLTLFLHNKSPKNPRSYRHSPARCRNRYTFPPNLSPRISIAGTTLCEPHRGRSVRLRGSSRGATRRRSGRTRRPVRVFKGL